MPFNGAGVYSPPAADFPAVASTLIESAKFNNVVNDLSTGLSGCITKDGQTTITANLPMAGFKFTGLGAGVARTDSSSMANVQDGGSLWGGTAGGTANALTLTLAPAIPAYVAGQTFRFKAAATNTGAVTVAISGLATKAIQEAGAALAGAEILLDGLYQIVYDGTAFQLSPLSIPAWRTGNVMLLYGPTADTGWVLLADGTIGSAASAASARANADTEALYTLFWNNTLDANCAVSTGRGANAAADFAANKTLALPKTKGRSLGCFGTGAGLSARALAVALGAEDAVVVDHGHGTGTLAANSNGDHNHTEQFDNTLDQGGGTFVIARDPGGGEITVTNTLSGNVTSTNGAHTHVLGGAIANSGVTGVGANMSPITYLNLQVKL